MHEIIIKLAKNYQILLMKIKLIKMRGRSKQNLTSISVYIQKFEM